MSLKTLIFRLSLIIFLVTACSVPNTVVPPTLTSAPATATIPQITLTPPPAPSVTGSFTGVIAFASMEKNEWQIYTMNADGSDQKLVTFGTKGGYEPTWSSDGTRIVFQYNGLKIADLATGKILRIPLDALSDLLPNEYLVKPSWSPDGEWIAFLNESGMLGDIYLVRPDGTDLKRLTESNDISRDGNLVWSPDGKKLAYSASRDGNIEVYVLDIEETLQGKASSKQLTDTAPPIRNLVTSWSPDGSRIAFSSDQVNNSEIYLMNPDGSDVVRLTYNPASDVEAAWSPDNSRIAFSSNRDGNFEIYILDVAEALQNPDNGSVKRLTNHKDDDVGPVWMPAP